MVYELHTLIAAQQYQHRTFALGMQINPPALCALMLGHIRQARGCKRALHIVRIEALYPLLNIYGQHVFR